VKREYEAGHLFSIFSAHEAERINQKKPGLAVVARPGGFGFTSGRKRGDLPQGWFSRDVFQGAKFLELSALIALQFRFKFSFSRRPGDQSQSDFSTVLLPRECADLTKVTN